MIRGARPGDPRLRRRVRGGDLDPRRELKAGSRSAEQWRTSMRDYVLPALGDKAVDQVTTADVMAVLLPIWTGKRETARRVRQRIGAVMKWAVAQGYRADNPAGDAISEALPKNGVKPRHQPALPHAGVGAALARVRDSGAYREPCSRSNCWCSPPAATARSATRDGRRSTSTARSWSIPAERMKAGREHRVPLSDRALAVLDEAHRPRRRRRARVPVAGRASAARDGHGRS